MKIADKRDDGDTTIYMTLTSTSTLGSKSSPNASPTNVIQIVSWVAQTIETTIVTSTPVLKVPSTSQVNTVTSKSITTVSNTAETKKVIGSSSADATISPSQSDFLSPTASKKVGAVSTIPIQNSFSDVSYSTGNRSLQIGLAIGIPIAIFSIFFIVLGIWYYIRERKRKRKTLSFNEKYYKPRESDATLTADKPYPVLFSPGAYFKDERQYELPQKRDRLTIRLSKSFPIRKKEKEISSTVNFAKRMSVLTPIFLKKFNLKKTIEENNETVKPQILSIPENPRENAMKPTDNLNLPPVITIGSSGLDPVRGGISPEQSLYTVIRSYNKSLGDELNIEVGDKAVILEKHSDGWCKIRLVRMGKDYYNHQLSLDIGLVPKMCLQKI